MVQENVITELFEYLKSGIIFGIFVAFICIIIGLAIRLFVGLLHKSV